MRLNRLIVRLCLHPRRSCSSSATNVHPHNQHALQQLSDCMIVHDDFISQEEEESLVKELEPVLRKIRYESNHWDNAIASFRETEKRSWTELNDVTISRTRGFVFGTKYRPLPLVHVLDLAAEGEIRGHIDAVRFCGDVIGGISLLSDSVLRLVHEKEPALKCDYLLRRRSLYVMRGAARYEYTHAVLGSGESFFQDRPVPRQRRISIILRCEPSQQADS